MWSIQDVSAEELARLLHHYRGALAHDSDSRNGETAAWEHTSSSERKLMVAAARLALIELAATPAPAEANRPYYTKPGEADWGC